MGQTKKNIKQTNNKSKNKQIIENQNTKSKSKKSHPTTILTIKNKEIEDNDVKSKNIKQLSNKKRAKKKLDFDEQPPKKKHPFIRFLFKIIIFSMLLGIAFLSYKAYIFKNLASEMFNNMPSNVYDTNRNLIAQIGVERHRENVDFSDIPTDLVHAYVAIEDQRFYTHCGIDIKRTGAAILSYVSNRRFFFIWWKYNNTTISKKFDW